MYIIIIGGGKLGTTLIDCLTKEGHDIALIDTNYKTVDSLVGKYDILGVCGNGATAETLKEAGVDRARIVIAATAVDEVNVLCAMMAKKMGAHHTVARVRAAEYSKQLVFMREELGIGMVVNPDLETAREISRTLRSMRTVKIDSFAKGRADLVEIRITEDSPFVSKRLWELYKTFKFKILVCAVQRGDDIIIPNGDFRLEVGDKINVTASHGDLDEMFKILGYSKQKVHSVMIVGGGSLGFFLARELVEQKIKVKIIESNEERCVELSEKLPKAQVILGNGTDQDLLSEEGFDEYDACVALTGIDEENIIISLCARLRNIKNIIFKVNNTSLLKAINQDNMDNAISPKNVTSNHIVRYVRSKEGDETSSVQTLYKLVDNKIEAVEFIVRSDSKCVGIPLSQMNLKNGILIACIVRQGKSIIPGGNDTIEVNDNVVVVSNNLFLRKLDEILEV
ncbi:MAG: Trk system potassium transporter TrkA [Clostridia bacterium]|nr:Trk system potassium transporter TrkA [Clostridia bacterium]